MASVIGQDTASGFDPGLENPPITFGVWGDSGNGDGVIGSSSHPAPETEPPTGPGGAGVFGLNNAFGGVGVRGQADQATGIAVLGTSVDGVGVTALSISGTALHARRQDTSGAVTEARLATPALAGDFTGDVKISGALAIGASTTAADNFHWATDTVSGPRGLRLYRGVGTHALTVQSDTGQVGVNSPAPLARLHVRDAGGFGAEDGNGVLTTSNVPVLAQSDSTAIGMLNAQGRPAFALNIDNNGGTATTRGIPTLYDRFDGTWHPCLSLKNGSVGVGTASPQRRLHVEGTEIHSGGSVGGLSFGNRNTASFVERPSAGERWVWYAQGGSARLWSGGDRLSVSLTAEGGGLDVARRMRVRQEADSSAGIWFFQTAPQADRAFVGMVDDTHVGFYGNTGARWGLSMDTSNGNVAIGTNNPIRVTSAWTGFPDAATNRAEICNDTGTYQTLMIVGNKSAGGLSGARRVSVWDRLEVNGPCSARSFPTLSDGRLKTDVAVLDTPLDRVAQLRGVSFRWQPDVAAAGPAGGIGVIAQNVAEVFPELVSTIGPQQHLAVDYSGLTAVLLEAVKELKAENERLCRRVDTLEDHRSTAGTPGLHIADEVSAGRFTIAGGEPGMRVSWQLTGVRHDPYALAHPLVVEVDKPPVERGHYLSPDLYDQTADRSIEWAREPRAMRLLALQIRRLNAGARGNDPEE